MFFKRSRKQGFSLAEVVVSLGVTATVMVIAISLTSQSLRLAKENEIENTANEILVQSLELAKSPVPLNISSSVTGQNAASALAGSYRIAKTNNPGAGNESVGVSFLQPTNASTNEITAGSCTQGSPEFTSYKVDLQGSEAIVCNQVILVKETGEIDTYRFISIIVYEIGGEDVVDRIEAFRKGNFNIAVF